MGTVSINDKLKKTYLTLIKGLDEDKILEIISELSLFLKKAKANNRNKVDFYSGSWVSEKSAEQIIFEVQELQIERSRVFNNVFAGTNILIFLFKGHPVVASKIRNAGLEKCYISEMSIAELKYGAEKSERPKFHHKILKDFISDIQIIPIYNSLDTYAKEKARHEKMGNCIDDFDLFIDSAAVDNDLILIINNTNHFKRIKDISIEDWTK